MADPYKRSLFIKTAGIFAAVKKTFDQGKVQLAAIQFGENIGGVIYLKGEAVLRRRKIGADLIGDNKFTDGFGGANGKVYVVSLV